MKDAIHRLLNRSFRVPQRPALPAYLGSVLIDGVVFLLKRNPLGSIVVYKQTNVGCVLGWMTFVLLVLILLFVEQGNTLAGNEKW